MGRSIALIGVPTSAGAFAPGQEQAPRALREAGLVDRLLSRGAAVVDHGDSPVWRWRPDRDQPNAQNLQAVVDQARTTADRVSSAILPDQLIVVLGGDCTVEIGTVSGHLASGDPDRFGLIYFDLHADLNTPESVPDGAFDWTGMAHMLGVESTAESLSHIGPRVPLLNDDQVLFFAVGREHCTPWENKTIDRRSLRMIPVEDVAKDPEGSARLALDQMISRCDRLLIHFDVDVIDFSDAPLSEHTGRGTGLSFDTAMRAFAVLASNDRVAAITLTELNPNHGEQDGSTLRAFIESFAEGLVPSRRP